MTVIFVEINGIRQFRSVPTRRSYNISNSNV